MQATEIVLPIYHGDHVRTICDFVSPNSPSTWSRIQNWLYSNPNATLFTSFWWEHQGNWRTICYDRSRFLHLLEHCSDVQRFGAPVTKKKPSRTYVAIHPVEATWSCFIHPALERRLSEAAAQWLMEPMPETLVLQIVDEDSIRNGISLSQLQADTLGPQPLLIHTENGERSYTCYSAVRISDGTQSRLKWLWNTEMVNQLRWLNQFSPSCRLYRLQPAMLFRDSARQANVLIVSPLYWKDPLIRRDVPESLYPARHLQSDYAAILSTLAGFTTLELQEVVALMFTWWLSALYNLVPLLSGSVARKTSMLLFTDIIARLNPVWQTALFDTLPSWKPFSELSNVRYCLDFMQSDDMRYLVLTKHGCGYPCIGDHRQLYTTLRLVLSQFGLTIDDKPDQYIHTLKQFTDGGFVHATPCTTVS